MVGERNTWVRGGIATGDASADGDELAAEVVAAEGIAIVPGTEAAGPAHPEMSASAARHATTATSERVRLTTVPPDQDDGDALIPVGSDGDVPDVS
jgi:hypothetical protein